LILVLDEYREKLIHPAAAIVGRSLLSGREEIDEGHSIVGSAFKSSDTGAYRADKLQNQIPE
jgi:hypothetical protein